MASRAFRTTAARSSLNSGSGVGSLGGTIGIAWTGVGSLGGGGVFTTTGGGDGGFTTTGGGDGGFTTTGGGDGGFTTTGGGAATGAAAAAGSPTFAPHMGHRIIPWDVHAAPHLAHLVMSISPSTSGSRSFRGSER